MDMKKVVPFLFVGFLASCGNGQQNKLHLDVLTNSLDTVKLEASQEAALPFQEIDTNYNSIDLLLPVGFKYDILFTEARDKVTRADGMELTGIAPYLTLQLQKWFLPDAL